MTTNKLPEHPQCNVCRQGRCIWRHWFAWLGWGHSFRPYLLPSITSAGTPGRDAVCGESLDAPQHNTIDPNAVQRLVTGGYPRRLHPAPAPPTLRMRAVQPADDDPTFPLIPLAITHALTTSDPATEASAAPDVVPDSSPSPSFDSSGSNDFGGGGESGGGGASGDW